MFILPILTDWFCIAWPNDIGADEIRAEVDYWAQQGVDSIKIKQATPGEMKILIEQAHKNGMTTTGHLTNYDGEYDVHLRDAILMGIDRIEHQITLGCGVPLSADMDQNVIPRPITCMPPRRPAAR